MTPKQTRFSLILFALIALGVLTLIVGAGVFHRQSVENKKLHVEIMTKKARLVEINKELEGQEQREQELAQLEERLKTLDKDLADYKYIPTYLEQIQRATVATGNTMMRIQPGEIRPLDLKQSPLVTGTASASAPAPAASDANKAATAPAYQVQRINLEVRGNYVSIQRLLNALRQFPKMVYVRSLNLSPRNERDNEYISAQIETYAIITPDQYQVAKGGSQVKQDKEASR